MVEKKYNGHYVIEIIGTKLEHLIHPVQTSVSFAREAMTDLLKFTFNILLYYPNVSGHKYLACANSWSNTAQMTEAEAINPDRAPGGPRVLGDFWDPKLDGYVIYLFVLCHLSERPVPAVFSLRCYASS